MIGRDVLDRRVVISGIGRTAYSRNSGTSVGALALEAIAAALQDAGIRRRAVEGIISFHMDDSAPVRDVATMLELDQLMWWSDMSGGGSCTAAVLAEASLLVTAGVAKHVLVYRSLNGRSGRRMGRRGIASAEGINQFLLPYGFGTAPQLFAMVAQRYLHQYGVTREALGHVAITMREHAALNEHAMRRDPITMTDYLEARMIAEPFGLLDCCLESDGAVALVVSAAAAVEPRTANVYVDAIAHGGGVAPRLVTDRWPDYTHSAFRRIGDQVFAGAQLRRDEIDVALLYDAFTFEVLQQLEELGFVGPGEAGDFVASGAIKRSGSLPVNPHGGLLSEGYIHGLNHYYEAVAQLRHEAGDRQVPGARTALVTGYGFTSGGAAILTRGDENP